MTIRPQWLNGLTHRDFLFDGRKSYPEEIWDSLDWSRAYVDMGPSPSGNLGPYWHVPLLAADDETVHRLYPKLLRSKWLPLVRQAVAEIEAKASPALEQQREVCRDLLEKLNETRVKLAKAREVNRDA